MKFKGRKHQKMYKLILIIRKKYNKFRKTSKKINNGGLLPFFLKFFLFYWNSLEN